MVTEADKQRWRNAGATEEQIATWERNNNKHHADAMKRAAQMLARYNQKHKAPGTAPTDTAEVIEHDPAACPKCKGSKWVITEPGGILKPCDVCGAADEIAQRRAASLDAYSSANGRANQQTFDNFKLPNEGAPGSEAIRQAFNDAKQWAAKPYGWLVLQGTPGTGKSHLCAAIRNTLRAAGRAVLFQTMPRLAASLKILFNDEAAAAEGETYEQRKEQYVRAPILIVDDIGAGTWSPYDERVLFDILDPRYQQELPTVLVSNLDMQDRDLFDPRLVDRWNDIRFSRVHVMEARSYRRHVEL